MENSLISLVFISENSSISPSSVAVQPGLCGTWSETPKTSFITTRLNGTYCRFWSGALHLFGSGCFCFYDMLTQLLKRYL